MKKIISLTLSLLLLCLSFNVVSFANTTEDAASELINVAQNANITASVDPAHKDILPASKMVDNKITSRYANIGTSGVYANEVTVTISLDKVYEISKLNIYQWLNTSPDLKVDVKVNGVLVLQNQTLSTTKRTFSNDFNGDALQTAQSGVGVNEFTFNKITGDVIQVRFHLTNNTQINILEIQAFGKTPDYSAIQQKGVLSVRDCSATPGTSGIGMANFNDGKEVISYNVTPYRAKFTDIKSTSEITINFIGLVTICGYQIFERIADGVDLMQSYKVYADGVLVSDIASANISKDNATSVATHSYVPLAQPVKARTLTITGIETSGTNNILEIYEMFVYGYAPDYVNVASMQNGGSIDTPNAIRRTSINSCTCLPIYETDNASTTGGYLIHERYIIDGSIDGVSPYPTTTGEPCPSKDHRASLVGSMPADGRWIIDLSFSQLSTVESVNVYAKRNSGRGAISRIDVQTFDGEKYNTIKTYNTSFPETSLAANLCDTYSIVLDNSVIVDGVRLVLYPHNSALFTAPSMELREIEVIAVPSTFEVTDGKITAKSVGSMDNAKLVIANYTDSTMTELAGVIVVDNVVDGAITYDASSLTYAKAFFLNGINVNDAISYNALVINNAQ